MMSEDNVTVCMSDGGTEKMSVQQTRLSPVSFSCVFVNYYADLSTYPYIF